jgi:hypothetical protein
MAYPIAPVARPSDLTGQTNGRLSPALLRPVGPRAGWSMHHLAARAWEAARAAALCDGIVLSYSGNPYRDYAGQEQLFRSRYTPDGPTTLDKTGRLWGGLRWYRHRGAPAAVPGTSNHGWGLAVDAALDADGDLDFEWPVKALDGPTLDWLVDNAARFGFSWESQVEPWHLRYVTGDAVPQAVRDHETGTAPTPAEHPLVAVARAIAQARTHVLRLGSGGRGATSAEVDAVKWCQILLTRRGFAVAVDGQFGPKTDRAVRAFQRANLAVCKVADGVVGPDTWDALTR